jgi:hypothetical protein
MIGKGRNESITTLLLQVWAIRKINILVTVHRKMWQELAGLS